MLRISQTIIVLAVVCTAISSIFAFSPEKSEAAQADPITYPSLTSIEADNIRGAAPFCNPYCVVSGGQQAANCPATTACNAVGNLCRLCSAQAAEHCKFTASWFPDPDGCANPIVACPAGGNTGVCQNVNGVIVCVQRPVQGAPACGGNIMECND